MSEVAAEMRTRLVPIAEGVAVGWAAEVGMFAAPTSAAALSVVLGTLLFAMVGGLRRAVAAALMGGFIFDDHHLAGGHGVLGTRTAGLTLVVVVAVAVGAGVAGDRWRIRAARRR